jgi:hypothetical protein
MFMFMWEAAFGACTRSMGALAWRKGVASREDESEQRLSVRVLRSIPVQALPAELLRADSASLLLHTQSWADLPSQSENLEVSALLMAED